MAIVLLAVLAAPASAVNNGIDGVQPGLQEKAETQSQDIAKHIGVSLTKLHLAVGWARFQKLVPNALTGTNEAINGDGDRDGPICEIAVNKSWFEPIPSYEKDEVLAHEVFHCFQKEITPEAPTEGSWIIEGLARWVDLALFPKTHLPAALKALTEYYEYPERSLFSRSYDSVGFWAHAEDVTDDLWRRIPGILRAGVHARNQAAFNAAVAGTDGEATFLSSWGSSAFDDEDGAPPDWRMVSPLDGRYFATTHKPDVVDGSSTFELKPYSTAQLRIEPNASEPLVKIQLDQSVHGRFGVETNYVDGAITSKTFCTAKNTSECAVSCPEGDSASQMPLTELPSQPLLGVASDQAGGRVQITYLNTQAGGECKPVTPPQPQPPPVPIISGISCEYLLPGFSNEIDPLLEHISGKHFALETTNSDGYVSYQCLFQYKGELVTVDKGGEEEEVFHGVIAIYSFVETLPSVAAAEKALQLKASSLGFVSTGGIGDEYFLDFEPSETNAKTGEEECGSIGAVRVDNVVGGFAIAGDDEACGQSARDLLATVAAEL